MEKLCSSRNCPQLLRMMPRGSDESYVGRDCQIKLINTTIGTGLAVGQASRDETRPGQAITEPSRQHNCPLTRSSKRWLGACGTALAMAIVNEIFLKLSLGQVHNFWYALGSIHSACRGRVMERIGHCCYWQGLSHSHTATLSLSFRFPLWSMAFCINYNIAGGANAQKVST